MSFDNLTYLANWAQIIGLGLTVLAVTFAVFQVRQSARIAQGTFLLKLEELSERHDAISERLRPSGDWAREGSGPRDLKEWIAVEDYLGFFEHCEILIRNGSLQITDFENLFGYRLRNVLAHPVIVYAKLDREREHWKLLWSLLRRLRLARQTEDSIKKIAAYAGGLPQIYQRNLLLPQAQMHPPTRRLIRKWSRNRLACKSQRGN